MKVQCSCGAKYAFDATPEMLKNPVKFVCPNCGQDSSDFVNGLIRQEFGGKIPPPGGTVVANVIFRSIFRCCKVFAIFGIVFDVGKSVPF